MLQFYIKTIKLFSWFTMSWYYVTLIIQSSEKWLNSDFKLYQNNILHGCIRKRI